MTCLWSLPCNSELGKKQIVLFPIQSYFSPTLNLKLLVERSIEMTLLRSLFTLKKKIIICCTGVLLVSWTCLALSSPRIFAQFFSLSEIPNLLLLDWLLSSSFRLVLISSLRCCLWPHYLSTVGPSLHFHLLSLFLLWFHATLTSCVLCDTLVYYSSPTGQEVPQWDGCCISSICCSGQDSS